MAAIFVFQPCVGAQTDSKKQDQSPEQLAATAGTYEAFLRNGSGTAESRREVQVHLGAVYFLLHRYRQSLDTLTPLLHENSPSGVKAMTPDPLEAQCWLVSGLDYLELNRLPDATRTLRTAVSMQPDSANARLALGDALARSDRMEDAIREFERQTRMTPSLPDAWYKLGVAHSQISVELSRQQVKPADQDLLLQLAAEELLAKGDNLAAARILFRLARASPVRPEVHAQLGTALLMLGYVKAAQAHFHEELINNVESPIAQLGLAQTAALNDDWSTVSETLDHLRESQPREFVRLLEFPPAGLITQAWARGQMDPPESFVGSAAGALWKSWMSDSNVISGIPAPEQGASVRKCEAARTKSVPQGNWLTEDCYSTEVAELKSRTSLPPAARARLAEGEFRLGEYQAALHSAALIHAADTKNGWAVYWLSKAHDALAEECFLKVGALNPDSARVHQMLAEHYTKLSDYPKAKGEFQSAIRLAPDAPDLHLGLGTVLSRSGEWDQAEAELRTTLQMTPNSAFAHYELGHVYIQRNLWQQAIEQLQQVPDDSTVVLSARLDLARAESEAGKPSEAIKDLLSVAALDHDGELYFRLSALYRKTGDDGRAREALATFKQRRAASLQTDMEEVGALEREQEVRDAGKPQTP